MVKALRVLVGCECSGTVRDAFLALGHEAVSCDLLPSENGGPHFQQDLLELLRASTGKFDIGVFHPPCDYLTVSGNRWFADDAEAAPGILTGEARREAQKEAVRFVEAIWECDIPRIAIENPIGRLSTLWRKPDQVVQPYYFGDPFLKATCLWLRGLPLLRRTSEMPRIEARPAVWKAAPGPTRKRDRSVTYPRFAAQMAEQWTQLP